MKSQRREARRGIGQIRIPWVIQVTWKVQGKMLELQQCQAFQKRLQEREKEDKAYSYLVPFHSGHGRGWKGNTRDS